MKACILIIPLQLFASGLCDNFYPDNRYDQNDRRYVPYHYYYYSNNVLQKSTAEPTTSTTEPEDTTPEEVIPNDLISSYEDLLNLPVESTTKGSLTEESVMPHEDSYNLHEELGESEYAYKSTARFDGSLYLEGNPIFEVSANEKISNAKSAASIASLYHLPIKQDHFYCYDCHSGALGHWQNILCPANGDIQGWAEKTHPCYGPCVSFVTRYPKGDVVRGCSANYWFPFRVPTSGCFFHMNIMYCFCSGHNCNDRDMEFDRRYMIQYF